MDVLAVRTGPGQLQSRVTRKRHRADGLRSVGTAGALKVDSGPVERDGLRIRPAVVIVPPSVVVEEVIIEDQIRTRAEGNVRQNGNIERSVDSRSRELAKDFNGVCSIAKWSAASNRCGEQSAGVDRDAPDEVLTRSHRHPARTRVCIQPAAHDQLVRSCEHVGAREGENIRCSSIGKRRNSRTAAEAIGAVGRCCERAIVAAPGDGAEEHAPITKRAHVEAVASRPLDTINTSGGSREAVGDIHRAIDSDRTPRHRADRGRRSEISRHTRRCGIVQPYPTAGFHGQVAGAESGRRRNVEVAVGVSTRVHNNRSASIIVSGIRKLKRPSGDSNAQGIPRRTGTIGNLASKPIAAVVFGVVCEAQCPSDILQECHGARKRVAVCTPSTSTRHRQRTA